MFENARKFVNRRILGKENPNLAYRVGLTTKLKEPEHGVSVVSMFYLGKEVGSAALIPRGKKDYLLGSLDVDEERWGEDFGANLLDAVNNFLDERGATASVMNGIALGPKRGMYERHGWRQKPGGSTARLHYTPKKESEK